MSYPDIKCFMLENTGNTDENGFVLYRRSDTGEVYPFLNPTPQVTPVGAMWWCTWIDEYGYNSYRPNGVPDEWRSRPRCYQPGPDGKYLAVQTPGGTWVVDSRCSNCALPNDNVHNCWIRHGEPPIITVDKAGLTCAAGAGSIQCGNYHGFLTRGILSERRDP